MRNSKSRQMAMTALITVTLSAGLAFPGRIGEEHLGGPTKAASARASLPDNPNTATQRNVAEAYCKLPLSFEANEGQVDSRVKFISRAGGRTLFLTSTEAVLRLGGLARASRAERSFPQLAAEPDEPPSVEARAAVLRMKLVGANVSAKATGLDELPGKSNYFIGSDPRKWRINVPNYAKVKYEQVYPGLDLVYYGNSRQLEYDFVIAPRADPGRIRLAFEGADRIHINRKGDLILGTADGDIRQLKPDVYQEIGGMRKEVAAQYVLRNKNHIGVSVSHYDTAKPLIIDPVLSYSTYLGGSDFDAGNAIAVDSSGNAYVAGDTQSVDYPVKNALQPAPVGEAFRGETFVTKLNSSGTALLYSTYLGGSNSDFARAVAVDLEGNAYVTGFTVSTNFPTANAFQPAHAGGFLEEDAFVTKINASGNALVYSTYLGGSSVDAGYGIAVDSSRSAYVTGLTSSSDFPTANPLQAALIVGFDTFITKFTPDGSALAYSTYLGGTGSEVGRAVAVDSAGQAYVAGATTSPDLPLASPLQPDYKGRTVFKSVSAGTQWVSINNGLPVTASVNALAVDRIVPSTVYAGTESNGLFKTTDGGGSWVATSLSSAGINAVEVDPRDSNVIFVVTNGAIHKSTNGGGSWALVKFGRGLSLAIDPSNSSIIYADNNTNAANRLSKTTNGGATWFDLPVSAGGLVAGTVRAIAIHPNTPSTLYVASFSNLVYKSVNGGNSWQLASQGLSLGGYLSLEIDPANPSTIYAGSRSQGVFKTTDGGDHWVRSLSGIIAVAALAIDAGTASVVYAGTSEKNLFKSTDAGSTWVSLQGQLGNSFIRALAVGGTSTIYAGGAVVSDGFLAKLSTGGASLIYSTYLGGDDRDLCTGIAIDGAGNAYVTGLTYAFNFPTANPVQVAAGGNADAFLGKLTDLGFALVYSTYLGGSGEDNALGIAVDSGGNAYITGFTYSTDFPLVNPLAEALSDINGNAFVAKLSSSGMGFAYSTYLGGLRSSTSFGDDFGIAVAVDSGGSAYVTGYTFSDQFPTTSGVFQPATHGFPDAFVSKLSLFDICLQDNTNGSLLQFNSASGDYVFQDCIKGTRLVGRGAIIVRGCKIELRDKGPDPKRPDRDVYALVSPCAHSGNGSVTVNSIGRTFTITDSSTTNSTCLCGT